MYIRGKGGWNLHSSVPSDERDGAVEEAKTLSDSPGMTAVRVVRNDYNMSSGETKESVAYSKGSQDDFGSAASANADTGGRRAARAQPAQAQAQQQAKAQAQKRKLRIFTKLFGLAFVGFVVAILITWVVTAAMESIPTIKRFLGSNATDVQIWVFLIAFVGSFASSAYAFISKEELEKLDRKADKFANEGKKKMQKAIAPAPPTKAKKKALAREAAKRSADRAAQAMQAEKQAALEEEKVAQADAAKSALDAAMDLAKQEDAARMQAELDAAAGLETQDEGEEPDQNEPEKPELGAPAEAMKMELMTFLSSGLQEVAKTNPKLDAFNKFGVNLYLAGACERMGLEQGLSDTEVISILTDSVEVLGTKRDQAERFASAYDSYLLDPKYLGMIEAGRGATEANLSGNPEAPKQLDNALKSWSAPKGDEPSSSGTIAVLFTDIVGSTAMTQTHGDAAAQEVVRTHNRIVRAALTTYQGREVKHTGDGIMASFANTAQAVEAGIYIQRKVASSKATNPAVPLGVKIGINAGEPIVEDDDLFGTTVQLSARIVDKAAIGQVMVSGVVRSICQGKAFVFADRGTREMKGFADPIQLFEAVWDTGGAQAAQPAPAAAPQIAAVSTGEMS